MARTMETLTATVPGEKVRHIEFLAKNSRLSRSEITRLLIDKGLQSIAGLEPVQIRRAAYNIDCPDSVAV